jgi:fibronectin-binding autotransporter adhesin
MNTPFRPMSRFIPPSLLIAVFLISGLASPRARAQSIWTGLGSDGRWATRENWQGDVVPVSGSCLIFGGTTQPSSTNNLPLGTIIDCITFNGPGLFNLVGNPITLDGNVTNNQVVSPQTISLGIGLETTPTLDVVTNGVLVISGAVSSTTPSTGLILSGGGQVTLSGGNAFTGGITDNGDSLLVTADGGLGAAPATVQPNNVILNGGTLLATNSITINANRGITLGPSGSSGSGTISVSYGQTVLYRGAMANNSGGTGGLNKLSFGTLILSGTNTYSGPTAISNGLVMLDFTQTSAPASPNTNVINPLSSLSLGGAYAVGATNYAELIMTNNSATAKSQTFNGTLINPGAALIRATNTSSGVVNLALGALSHNAGGFVTFLPPWLKSSTAGQITASGGNYVNSSNQNTGIIGGWAYIGNGATPNAVLQPVEATNLACLDANGNVTNYSAYTLFASTGTTNIPQMFNANNVTVDLPFLATLAQQSNNLYVSTSSTGDTQLDYPGKGSTNDFNTVTLNRPAGSAGSTYSFRFGTNNILRLGKFGALFCPNNTTGSSTWEIGDSTTGNNNVADQDSGILTAGGPSYNSSGEIVMLVNSTSSSSAGNLDVDVQIADNGPNGPVTFVKGGPGYMKLIGHNTYSGGTYLLQGRMQFAGNQTTGETSNSDGMGTGPVYVFPGAYLFAPPPGFTNTVYLAGNGTQQEPLGAWRASGNGTNNVILIGDATLGGNGGVWSGPVSGPFNLTVGSGATTAGVQTVSLDNQSNSWTGNLIMQASKAGNCTNELINGTNEVIPDGFGFGNVVMTSLSGTEVTWWDLNGYSETINGLSTPSGGASGACQVTNSTITNSLLTLGNNNQSASFAGSIGGPTLAVTKIGTGTETLTGTNSFTGNLTINAGSVAIGGGGKLTGTSNVIVNTGGTLDITGTTGAGFTTTNVTLSGGTMAGNTGTNGITGTLGMANGALTVSINPGVTNVFANSLSFGGTTNFLNIQGITATPVYPTNITIIQYTNATIGGTGFGNFGIGTVPTASITGYLSNDTVNLRIVFVVLNGPKPQWWNGGTDGTTWSTSVPNWYAFDLPPLDVANNDDPLTFDDTALPAATNVFLSGSAAFFPASLLVSNNVLNYTFLGTNAIGGGIGLAKLGTGILTVSNTGGNFFSGGVNVGGGTVVLATDGLIAGGATISNATTLQVGMNTGAGLLPSGNVNNAGTLIFNRGANETVSGVISGTNSTILKEDAGGMLTLAAANTFTGAVTVVAGTLQTGNGAALGQSTNQTTIDNNATLDVNGQNLGASAVNVTGPGVGGNGAIVNSGGQQINALRNVNVTGNNVTFGGTGRWDIRESSTSGSGSQDAYLTNGSGMLYTLTKVGPNQVSLVGANVDLNLGDVDILAGQFDFQLGGGGASIGMGNAGNTINVSPGATLGLFQFAPAGGVANKKIALNSNNDGVTPSVDCESGGGPSNPTQNVLGGTLTLNGNCVFSFAGGGVTVNSTINDANPPTITGGITQIGGTLSIGAGPLNYSGPTLVQSGTLFMQSALNGNGIVSNAPGSTIVGNAPNTGTAGAVIINGGRLVPGGFNSGGTFSTGALTINTNATLVLDLANGGSDQVAANGTLTVNGTNILQLVPMINQLETGGAETIMTYTGPALPTSATNQFVLSNSLPGYTFALIDPQATAGSPNNLVITNVHVPVDQTWTGGQAPFPTQWDVGVTPNWTSNATAVQDDFNFGDYAVFNDGLSSGLYYNVSVTNEAIEPIQVEFGNSANAYTLSGQGWLTGPMQMIINGQNTVVIANGGNSNSFSGGVSLRNGTLQLGNADTNGLLGTGGITNANGQNATLVFDRSDIAVLSNYFDFENQLTTIIQNGSGVTSLRGILTNIQDCAIIVQNGTLQLAPPSGAASISNSFAHITVTNSATLDLSNAVANLQELPITVSGSGVNGEGAIYNSGNNGFVSANVTAVTLAANTTIGGSGRWDWRDEQTTNINASLSTIPPGTPYNLTKVGTNQVSMVGVQVDPGFGNFIVSNGFLSFEVMTTFGNAASNITIWSNASVSLYQLSNKVNKALVLEGGAQLTNSSGSNFFIGPITTTGSNDIGVAGTWLEIDGLISGTGGIARTGGSALYLSTNEAYTGPTWVTGGTLLLTNLASGAPANDASIASSSAIILNGGTINVTPLSTHTLTALSSQSVSGTGTIAGSLVVNGPFAPGFTASTLTNGTGTLTVTNNASINGTSATTMYITATGKTNTVLVTSGSATSINCAGSIFVTNVAGNLKSGMSFPLFTTGSGGFGGAGFSPVTLPPLGPGLSWNNNLVISGTITVGGTLTPPSITSESVAGPTLIISGNNGIPNGTFKVLASLSVTNPVATWTPIATNTYSATGTFSVPVTATNSAQFFLISE